MQAREQELQKQALSAQARASELEQQLARQAEILKRQEQDIQLLQGVRLSSELAESPCLTHARHMPALPLLARKIPGIPDHAWGRVCLLMLTCAPATVQASMVPTAPEALERASPDAKELALAAAVGVVSKPPPPLERPAAPVNGSGVKEPTLDAADVAISKPLVCADIPSVPVIGDDAEEHAPSAADVAVGGPLVPADNSITPVSGDGSQQGIMLVDNQEMANREWVSDFVIPFTLPCLQGVFASCLCCLCCRSIDRLQQHLRVMNVWPMLQEDLECIEALHSELLKVLHHARESVQRALPCFQQLENGMGELLMTCLQSSRKTESLQKEKVTVVPPRLP